ncbi:hypothetical protein B0H14DRAFT_2638641 [Mycena olivaceomarginata]|nr:hypothetical protein B0H14DRAFT_2638641 [Mycena olivaceomarginata]
MPATAHSTLAKFCALPALFWIRFSVRRRTQENYRDLRRGGGRVQPRHVLEHLPNLAIEREVEGKNRNKAEKGEEETTRNNKRKTGTYQTKGAQVFISCLRWWSPCRMSRMRERLGFRSGGTRNPNVCSHLYNGTNISSPWHSSRPSPPPSCAWSPNPTCTFCTLYRARAGDKGNSKWTIANARRAVQTPDALDEANNSWEIHIACATPVLDKANSSWTIGKDVDEAKTSWKINEVHATPIVTTRLTVRKCAAPTPDLGWCPNAYFYRSQVNSNNTSWHIGSWTALTLVACAVSPDLVDSDNTRRRLGAVCRLRSPAQCLPICNNTSWKIGGSVPTPVAHAVSPDLADSDNTSWKILCNPVVQARAENVDSDNKSWEIHDTREEIDAANTIGSNEACAMPIPDLVDGGSLTEVLLWPLYAADYRGGA